MRALSIQTTRYYLQPKQIIKTTQSLAPHLTRTFYRFLHILHFCIQRKLFTFLLAGIDHGLLDIWQDSSLDVWQERIGTLRCRMYAETAMY
jgi:hypothetical protein